jgi:hypothetical protein
MPLVADDDEQEGPFLVIVEPSESRAKEDSVWSCCTRYYNGPRQCRRSWSSFNEAQCLPPHRQPIQVAVQSLFIQWVFKNYCCMLK